MAKKNRTELQQEYEQTWEDLADFLWQVALVEGFRANLSQILEFLKGHGVILENEYPRLTIHQRILGDAQVGNYEDFTQDAVEELRLLAVKLKQRLRSFVAE